jgi:pimeloyl-ACP methyl ester carboxylesterase
MHVLAYGEKGRPPILFLHGFPEAGISWEWYLNYFAALGFYAMAPDQRGYGRSAKPAQVSAYAMQHLVEDIRQLVQQLCNEPPVVVGHDWGGGVAWHFAHAYPQLLQQLVIINMPHPIVFRQTLRTNINQMMRSIYVAYFQLPLLPERTSSAFHFAALRRTLSSTSLPGTFSKRQWIQYMFNWQQKGALRSMINWYRAYRFSTAPAGAVTVPALLLWGKKDAFLRWQMANGSAAWCTCTAVKFWDNATHWLHHEYREEVALAITEHIRKPKYVRL